jgi:frataxin-like iron-binding protein CyaY
MNLFTYLSDKLEENYSTIFDEVDLSPGTLKIILSPQFCETAHKGTFLISRHGPTRQIWYASPVSGATHFALKEGIWTSTQSVSVTFPHLLAQELSHLTGQGVSLTHVS